MSSRKVSKREKRRRQSELKKKFAQYHKAQREYAAVWTSYQRSLPQYDNIWAGFEENRLKKMKAQRQKAKKQQQLAREGHTAQRELLEIM